MSRKKQTFTAEFKSKVVLELLESGKTLNEVASKHKILPRNLQNWKTQFLANMSLAFDNRKATKAFEGTIEILKKENDQLAKKLGKTIIERDWAVEKLKSLDLSERKEILSREAIQARNSDKKPSQNRCLELLSVSKKAFYYVPKCSFKGQGKLLNKIDEIYTEFPYYGARRILKALRKEDVAIGLKKVRRAMKFMGLKAIYQEPKTTIAVKEHKKYPYLLKAFKNAHNQVIITEANKVWSADITYIRLEKGFVYLAAIIDWGTKKILSWKLSNTMDVALTTSVLKDALSNYPKPQIFNSDQGSQYTATEHVTILCENDISISMDGKGRSIDNIAIERFWRSLKYENVYLNDYTNKREAEQGIKEYIELYNSKRLHSTIGYETPDNVYFNNSPKEAA